MKTNEEIKKSLGNLSEVEENKIEHVIGQLKSLQEKKAFDEEGLRILEIVITELNLLHTSYKWRIIRLLKEGYLL